MPRPERSVPRSRGPMPVAGDLLPVLDMGLDFRSYQNYVDDSNQPALGNVINFPADKVPDTFEPTVGLLVTVLHFHCQSATSESAKTWLSTYEAVQKLFIENQENKPESRRFAEDARKAIASSYASGATLPDDKLCEKLLIFLDHQSGIKGMQAPSQRRIPRDPKGTFCNLHLSDHRCNQEFACNQLHLHQAGPVKHRCDFHLKMIDVLLKEGLRQEEIVHRLKDSLLYARFGNRVTVRFGNASVPFFKTAFTVGRLHHALRLEQRSCLGRNCQDGQKCVGIHVQDERNLQLTKQMDLPSPTDLALELESEATQLYATHEAKGVVEPIRATSPTSEQWRNTVRDYVRQAGIHEVQADEALLRSLEGVKVSTPNMNASGSTDTFTPLLHEVDMKRFDSNLSTTEER
jgi:hypothetical protein